MGDSYHNPLNSKESNCMGNPLKICDNLIALFSPFEFIGVWKTSNKKIISDASVLAVITLTNKAIFY